MTTQDFDWQNDESVVLQLQPATAVYTNPYGVIVIRQRDEYMGEDQWFYVTRECAAKLAKALIAEDEKVEVAEAEAAEPDPQSDEPLLKWMPGEVVIEKEVAK